MDNLFINTTEEEAIKIAKHIRCEYVGISTINGAPTLKIINIPYWKYYYKFISAAAHPAICDYMTIDKKEESYIRIFQHNPELFKHNMRFEKLKRILKEYE